MKSNSDWATFLQTPSEQRQQGGASSPSEAKEEIRQCATKTLQLMEELRDLFRPFAEGEKMVGTW